MLTIEPGRDSVSNAGDRNSRFFQRENLRSKYIWPRNLRRFVLEGTTPTMKKLIILTPLLAFAAVLLTSCTTVVEKPAPTTTTTTHSETIKRAPTTSTETTVRSSGNYSAHSSDNTIRKGARSRVPFLFTPLLAELGPARFQRFPGS